LPGGGLNIAHEALDRHVTAGHGDQVAIRWLGKDSDRRDITYAALAADAARFANVLSEHGLKPGARVFALIGRVPELYAAALGTLKAALDQGGYGDRTRIVRINGLDTPWGADDARAVKDMDAEAVLLPKVNTAADVEALAQITGGLPIWAMMETPRGMLNAPQIAAHPKIAGLVMGTNDLAKELNTRFRPDRQPLLTSLGLCLLAAKAEGIIIVDGVYNAFKDDEGLLVECTQGRDMGFDGKTLIHPAQVDVTNTAYAPSEAEIDLARRQIAAFEEIEASGQGVAVVDGKIVENLHVATARETLAKAKAIAAMQTE